MSCKDPDQALKLCNSAAQDDPNSTEQVMYWAKDPSGCCKIIYQGEATGIPTYRNVKDCMGSSASGNSLNSPCDQSYVSNAGINTSGVDPSCYSQCGSSENYLVAPWSRPTNYLSLNNTWATQKKYQL